MGWKAIKDHYRIRHFVQLVPGEGVCIGSGFTHDIIVINHMGGVEKPYRPERGWSVNEDLARYQAEFDADPAKLKELLDQPDTFERSITVYTYDGAAIIECACEKLEWPNVTHDGRMMYENTFSTDRAEVVRWAIRNARARVEAWTDNLDERVRHLQEAAGHLARVRSDLWCWGKTKDGAPKHPMARGLHRIPRDQQPIMWRAAA
ncbi:hypothetical protein [Sphingomonas sanxanigenens]|uniref:Uncharacterized protein n=1 Tax=Sphingomonas sanxanigenens DSM 19645 = NX02 TaxID=1123269 RepID=W0AIF8_9SPHN|nr:hypothetical protein [Sphingomonas sanxanigenens]AHE56053.1 hypothetical protein NX02_22140 [Sphingomonas sanxanigenens DSM 19645 = NX02]